MQIQLSIACLQYTVLNLYCSQSYTNHRMNVALFKLLAYFQGHGLPMRFAAGSNSRAFVKIEWMPWPRRFDFHKFLHHSFKYNAVLALSGKPLLLNYSHPLPS